MIICQKELLLVDLKYIAEIFSELKYRDNNEIVELKKVRKNISSIITTNYDKIIEDLFGFPPLK